mmetsp:Transcript_37236/g.112408  ORF Transcript_37236/g.112408 Transcript_37236/m.112408 type:complete len:343 (-) Transcript_37236:213-1241(-)
MHWLYSRRLLASRAYPNLDYKHNPRAQTLLLRMKWTSAKSRKPANCHAIHQTIFPHRRNVFASASQASPSPRWQAPWASSTSRDHCSDLHTRAPAERPAHRHSRHTASRARARPGAPCCAHCGSCHGASLLLASGLLLPVGPKHRGPPAPCAPTPRRAPAAGHHPPSRPRSPARNHCAASAAPSAAAPVQPGTGGGAARTVYCEEPAACGSTAEAWPQPRNDAVAPGLPPRPAPPAAWPCQPQPTGGPSLGQASTPVLPQGPLSLHSCSSSAPPGTWPSPPPCLRSSSCPAPRPAPLAPACHPPAVTPARGAAGPGGSAQPGRPQRQGLAEAPPSSAQRPRQ